MQDLTPVKLPNLSSNVSNLDIWRNMRLIFYKKMGCLLCYQSWHEMNQVLTPVMLQILTFNETWVKSSLKKSDECLFNKLCVSCNLFLLLSQNSIYFTDWLQTEYFKIIQESFQNGLITCFSKQILKFFFQTLLSYNEMANELKTLDYLSHHLSYYFG